MPVLGLGVFQVQDGKQVTQAVSTALDMGYRHIDTAAIYGNEKGVGQAIAQHRIPRNEVFITSKLWNADQGYQSTLQAFEQSLERLQTDYLDLYLIHWPVPGKYKHTWRAMEKLYKDGRIKAIGVSNFLQHQLEDLMASATIKPMVNQMEFHPLLVQQSLMDFCINNEIQYEAWSPLMQGKIFDIGFMQELATKYNKTVAQITLRWDLQKGVVTIPKSVRPERIKANAELFDFEIAPEDIDRIDALDKHQRIGPDPDNFNF